MAKALTAKEYNIDISMIDFKQMKGKVSTEDLDRLLAEKP